MFVPVEPFDCMHWFFAADGEFRPVARESPSRYRGVFLGAAAPSPS